MPRSSAPDELLTARRLAHEAGISETIVRKWADRDPRHGRLHAVETVDGHRRFRWSDLEQFCRAHPGLSAASKVLRQPRDAGTSDAGPKASAEAEDLRAVVRDLRSAIESTMRAASEAARSHAEQMDALAKTIAAYDSALSKFTAPDTLND